MKDVTIIIAVYNEVSFIKEAILSAVEQAEFVLISDNCSTDGTQLICKELAKKYNNIIFFQQKRNIGMIENGKFLFSKVQTKYLLCLGGHDYIEKNYVQALKESYEQDDSVIASYAPYYSIDEKDTILEENLLDKLDKEFYSNNKVERILASIEHPEYIFMIFGLYETSLVSKYWDFNSVAGTDRLTISNFASIGKFKRVPSTKLYRRVLTRNESDEAYMKRIICNNANYDLTYMCEKQLSLLNKHCNPDNPEDYIQRAEKYFEQKCYRYYDKYKEKAQKEYEFLQNLNNSNEKFILYGAGMEADYTIRIMQDSLLFLADKDPIKQTQKKAGLKIKPPQSLLEFRERIIISHITNFDTILRYLLDELGIDPSRILQLPTQSLKEVPPWF